MSDETARAALGEALDALIERGETVVVWPTVHDVTTNQLHEIADDVRREMGRPDLSIASVDAGLTYELSSSMH